MNKLSLLFTIHFVLTANPQPLITFNTKTDLTIKNNSPLSVLKRYLNNNCRAILT